MDEQSLKPTNEIVKLILHSQQSVQVEIPVPVQLEKIYFYEAQTQTSINDLSDCLSKDADDEARLIGSNKYALLSLDEYQILRTGEEHCLKKYFSDDDRSLSEGEDENLQVEQQLKQMNLDDRLILSSKNDNLNNNASTVLHRSHSSTLSNTFYLDDNTHLSATLAQSTSSHISHSRYLPVCQAKLDDDDEDDELDQLVASTFTPLINTDDPVDQQEQVIDRGKLSSIRQFVRQAIQSCQKNLTLIERVLENLPSSSYEHVLQRKVRRIDCIMNIPKTMKGLEYFPSTSVQTE